MKPLVTIKVVGLNQLRLINSLKAASISLKDLRRFDQKNFVVTIAAKDKGKTVEMLETGHFEYEIISESGFRHTVRSILPRLGLIFGMAVMTALAIYASTFLWKIEVVGNERLDELTIVRALGQSGVKVGGKKKDFSAEAVKETLLSLSDVSAVSAELIGTTLRVEIVESTVVSPPKQLGEIVSLYDTEITRLTVNSGTSKVKIGDRVPMGAVLIEGVEYDTAGNKLSDVVPEGKVYGKVNFTYSEVVSLVGERVRTGKFTKSTVLKFFGLTIGKHKEREGCETETTTTRIGSFFPLYAENKKYYELSNLPDISLEEARSSVIDKAVNNLVIKAGGSPIETTATTAQIADKVYKITVHIEAEISVGGKRIG